MNTSIIPTSYDFYLNINGKKRRCCFFGTPSHLSLLKITIGTNTKLTIFKLISSSGINFRFLCSHEKRLLGNFKYNYTGCITTITPIYLCINEKTNELYWGYASNIPQEMK